MNNYTIDTNSKVKKIKIQIIPNKLFICIKGKCCYIKYNSNIIIKKLVNKGNQYELLIDENFIKKCLLDNKSNKIKVIDLTINKKKELDLKIELDIIITDF